MCKTKNYCSKICRKADDNFHKVCCKQGNQVEERKVKIGGREKVEVADAALKDHLTRSASMKAHVTSLFNTRDFKEGLRHDTKLMRKIERKEGRKLKDVEERKFNEVD